MRTTLDISDRLLQEVMDVTGAKTKSQAIHLALEDLLARTKRKRLLMFKGKIDLDIDLDALRSR
jgi:Arc/MetJ family transcription regulator